MKENIIADKTFKFALRIIDVNKELVNSKKEYVLSKQLLRAGPSISANVNEAIKATKIYWNTLNIDDVLFDKLDSEEITYKILFTPRLYTRILSAGIQ